MGFRTKLILLVVLVNLLAAGAVWQLFSSARSIKEQVQLFVPLSNYLEGISATHSALTRQNKEVFDYLISQEELNKREFATISLELEQSFHRWKKAAIQQQMLGVEGEHEDLELVDRTYLDYQHWQESLIEIFELAERGSWALALGKFQILGENSLNQRLLPAFDVALNDGMIEAEDTYHALILAVGGSPWGASNYAEQLEIIHTSMDFFVGGNSVNASINRQFSHLIDYLLQGHEKSLLNYEHSLAVSREALSFWTRATQKKALLYGLPPGDFSPLVTIVDASFQRFLQQAATAIEFKKAGRTAEALDLIIDQDLLIADLHDGTSLAIQEGAGILVSATNARLTAGFILLLLFFGASSLFSIRMSRDILGSAETLNSGMKAIHSGDFAHRINLKNDDFIGNLAQTFNTMMDSLCQTQASLEQLTTELEQRVEDRTSQLVTANRDLEAFNAMVSHDLRNPLTVIYGYSEILHEKHIKNGPPQILEIVNNVMTACDDMSRIVSALESLSQASHKKMARESVPLGEMVKKNIAQLSATEEHRKVDLIIHQAPEANGDKNLLEIVMTNLVSNAWKYSGKSLEPRIEFGAKERGGKAVWYIRDNGVGFDMKKSDQLFKTFGRLHSAKGFNGTGIGLATVQRIIHRHGGEIWAEGEEGQGATFYFHFGA